MQFSKDNEINYYQWMRGWVRMKGWMNGLKVKLMNLTSLNLDGKEEDCC